MIDAPLSEECLMYVSYRLTNGLAASMVGFRQRAADPANQAQTRAGIMYGTPMVP